MLRAKSSCDVGFYRRSSKDNASLVTVLPFTPHEKFTQNESCSFTFLRLNVPELEQK